MAKTSIGELHTKITASAEPFNRVLKETEGRLTGFAKLAAMPFKGGLGLGGQLSSLLVNPLNALMTPLSKLIETIPGLDDFGERLDLKGKIDRSRTALQELLVTAKQGARIGVSAQFLRGVQDAAEDEGEAVFKGFQKAITVAGEARMGLSDLSAPGGRSALDKFKSAGFAPNEFLNLNRETYLLRLVKAISAIEDPYKRAEVAEDFFGKSAKSMTNTIEEGTVAIEKHIDKLKEQETYTTREVALAKLLKDVQKSDEEGKRQSRLQEAETVGAFDIAKYRWKEGRGSFGDVMQTWDNTVKQSGWSWARYIYNPWAGMYGGGVIQPDWFMKQLAAEESAEKKRQAAPPKTKASEEVTKAKGSLKELNDQLDRQQNLLKLTESGWGAYADEVLKLNDLVAKGGDRSQAQQVFERLRQMAQIANERKESEREATELESIREQIRSRMGGGGRQAAEPFAPSATFGSADAARSFQRAFAFVGAEDSPVVRSLDELRRIMQDKTLPPELERNVDIIAREMQEMRRNQPKNLGPAR